MSQNMRVLAFDFGERWIGVACGQLKMRSGQCLDSVGCKQGKPQWNDLLKLVNEWQPKALLVGLPLHMDGTENESCRRARKFSNRLHQQTKLPVHLVDERLTSDAADLLDEALGDIHGRSALLILQQWYNEQE